MKNANALVPDPPKGWAMFRWLGPGFLWMVSAAGSGELLFTPRVGSMYGYTLLWAIFAAVLLKFFINREVGRYAVCTGKAVIDGFAKLPGPKNWALWIILIPQLLVAVISIAGLGGGAATALTLFLPGSNTIWMIVSVLTATALVYWGRYKGVEKASIVLAALLALASIVAAVLVAPPAGDLIAGMTPRIPKGTEIGEVLPWLGFMMSGAAGMMWYSYWIPAKKYGMAGADKSTETKKLTAPDQQKLKGWIRLMTLDSFMAVLGTVIITIAFLILGAELLKPKGLVPEENKVAETLGQILGSLWGPVGFWFMIIAVFIGFWDTVLSDQDGHSRLFANGTKHLLGKRLKSKWAEEKFLKRFFIIGLVTILPIVLYLFKGNPVDLLKISGAIEAAHIPIVTGLTLYLNHKILPPALKPSAATMMIAIIAALFFTVFAVLYVLEVTGLIKLN